MAVYTHVNEHQLSIFLQDYAVGHAISFKGIAEGVENSNYLLDTNKGRFILTLYEKRVDEKDLPFFLSLMNHMANNGLPSARPIMDKNGQVLKSLCNRPAALIEFVEGVSRDRPTIQDCATMGIMAARAHLSVKNFEQSRENNLSLQGWKKLALQCSQSTHSANKLSNDLQSLIDDELKTLMQKWPSPNNENLPRGVVHADFFPDNILFNNQGKISGLIDFYFSCTDYFIYDLAICLNAWCFNSQHIFEKEKWDAMLNSYEKLRLLSQEEHNIFPLMARGAALRFLLTRLYDWLNQVEGALVTVKDPDEYIKKLTFHRDHQNFLL